MGSKIRIMLVEDNPEYQRVLKFAFKADPDMDIVGCFGFAERAIRNIKHMSPSDIPDLILLDLNLPGLSGFESMPQFFECSQDLKIIVLTQSDSEADVLSAISQGASGYLLKSSSIEQIKEGARTVMDGGASLDSKVARFVFDVVKTKLPEEELDDFLTERELEVLKLIAEGKIKKEIADQLDISYFTVAVHIRHIYEKLNVTNAPAAVTKAYRTGIFQTGKYAG